MKNELIFYPQDTLTQKAKPVQKFDANLYALLDDMEENLLLKNGVGIAAPQVNVSLRCFLVYFDNSIFTFINPKITDFSIDTGYHEEGCLSVPGVYAEVERPSMIKITAQDRNGTEFSLEESGFFARIVQHEYDHLNGILFFEHLAKGARRRLLKSYEKLLPSLKQEILENNE